MAIGVVAGAMFCSLTGLVLFAIGGMNTVTFVGAVSIPAAVAIAIERRRIAVSTVGQTRQFVARIRMPWKRRASLRPFVAFSGFCALVSTRTLGIAYQQTSTGLSAGSLAVWADWAAHLAYASSFAYGDNRSFINPNASGTRLRYHFLADFFPALFTRMPVTLPQALTVTSWAFAVVLPMLLWCVVLRLSGSRFVAGLSSGLFFLNGGLGFWWFFSDLSKGGAKILTALPQTYARLPDRGIMVDNAISASLYAQRSTQMGMSVGLAALLVILASRPSRNWAGYLFAGLLVGGTGIAHGHMLLSALALASMAFIRERRREWLWFLLPAAVVGLPLAAMVLPTSSAVRFLPGFMAEEFHQSWPWFWFRNIGLFLPLTIWISVFGGGQQRVRKLMLPLWLWFVVPNLVAFHPWSWNNTKYFLFWQLGWSIVLADWLRSSWLAARSAARSTRGPARQVRRVAVAVGLVGAGATMMLSGSLDAVRAMQTKTAIPWTDNDGVAMATWIRSNTPTHAVIAHAPSNTSPVTALTGRPTVSGFLGWTWDLGLPDWAVRSDDQKKILAGQPDALELVRRYRVTYVVIGPEERQYLSGSDSFWTQHSTAVKRFGSWAIYQLSS